MKTYITSIKREDGHYEGPRIYAYSLWEAEGIVARLEGVILDGELGG